MGVCEYLSFCFPHFLFTRHRHYIGTTMDFHPADSDDDGDGVSGDVGDGAKDDGRKTLDEHMLIDKKVEAPNVLQLGTAPIFRSRPTSILSTPSPANNFLCFYSETIHSHIRIHAFLGPDQSIKSASRSYALHHVLASILEP
jgi:hypothetical protein